MANMFVKNIIDVNTGKVNGCNDGSILRSVAIGSCIAVVACGCRHRAGCIAHVMLPGRSRNNDKNTKYAADAIDELVTILAGFGVEQANIEVCLIGAGNVLEKPDDTICQANIVSVEGILKENNIPVRASVLGGYQRKSVMIDVACGKVSYTEGNGGETFLWQAGSK